jgi:hypothetical protein
MRVRSIVLAAIVAAIGAFVAEVSSAAHSASPPLVLALSGKFTSPVVSTGTFVAGGAVSDTGTHRDVTTFSPRTGRPTEILIHVSLKGSKGTLAWVATVPARAGGFISPGVALSSLPGASKITAATGAYRPFLGATSGKDLSFTSNPLQPGAPGTPKPSANGLEVIESFAAR